METPIKELLPMHGVITAHRIPLVEIVVGGKPLQFLIDTGFNGVLALPVHVIKSLKLKERGKMNFTLADGGTVAFPFYTPTVKEVFGVGPDDEQILVIQSGDEKGVIGMRFLEECEAIFNLVMNNVVIDHASEE